MIPAESSISDMEARAARATSELNNLLQIIGGTTELLENIWEGTKASEKSLAMLKSSVARAAAITAQLVENAGGVSGRIAIATPSAAETMPRATRKKRVLVVDDEPMGRILFEQLLTNANFEVVVARSGFEALDLLACGGGHFDVVTLDYSMPFMNGEEVFRRMRAINSDLRVILVTGFVHRIALGSLLEEGLFAYIGKPLPPAELLAEVRRAAGEAEANFTVPAGQLLN